MFRGHFGWLSHDSKGYIYCYTKLDKHISGFDILQYEVEHKGQMFFISIHVKT